MENTLGAFRSAGAAGITTWELDVHFDVHGTPVVLHDDTVDRVSPKSGPIAGLDTSGHGVPTDDGQYVPSLREVYDLARQFGAHVLTEIKVPPTTAQWTEIGAEIDSTIGRSAVTVMSFERPIVLAAREHLPGTPTGLLHGAGYLAPEQVRQYGDAIMQSQGALNAGRAASWQAAGIAVFAWTVDTPAQWQTVASWPVDAVITNKPIAYSEWAARQCGAAT